MKEPLVIPIKIDTAEIIARVKGFAENVEHLIESAEDLSESSHMLVCSKPVRWQECECGEALRALIAEIRPVVDKAKQIRRGRGLDD